MRLSLASIPAAIITLLLFLMMQTMIGLQDPRFVEPPRGRAVAFVDLAGLLRQGSGIRTPATDLPPGPAPAALPPLPDLEASRTWHPSHEIPEVTSARAFAQPPEVPLDLRGLTLPPRPVSPPPRPSKQPEAQTVDRSPATRPDTAVSAQHAPPAQAADPTGRGQQMGETDAPSGEGASVAATGRSGGGQGGDTEARPLVRVEPDYPRKAVRAGQEGWVRLAFTITPSGSVTDVVVVDAQPRRVFERSAQRALEQWRFQPQLINGRAVPRQAVQVIEFKLAGRG